MAYIAGIKIICDTLSKSEPTVLPDNLQISSLHFIKKTDEKNALLGNIDIGIYGYIWDVNTKDETVIFEIICQRLSGSGMLSHDANLSWVDFLNGATLASVTYNKIDTNSYFDGGATWIKSVEFFYEDTGKQTMDADEGLKYIKEQKPKPKATIDVLGEEGNEAERYSVKSLYQREKDNYSILCDARAMLAGISIDKTNVNKKIRDWVTSSCKKLFGDNYLKDSAEYLNGLKQ